MSSFLMNPLITAGSAGARARIADVLSISRSAALPPRQQANHPRITRGVDESLVCVIARPQRRGRPTRGRGGEGTGRVLGRDLSRARDFTGHADRALADRTKRPGNAERANSTARSRAPRSNRAAVRQHPFVRARMTTESASVAESDFSA